MTRDEALAKADTRWWETATTREIVEFQLYEDLLCMPFGDYHEAIEDVLGRPVWTHEFADPATLRTEFEGRESPPGSPLESLIRVAGPDVTDKTIVVGGEKGEAAP